MTIEIKVPTVGESINEVILASWLVSDGDYVEMDQMLCELESDKATFEVPAEKAGSIKIIAEVDTELEIGAVLCSIDTSATPAQNATTEKKAEAPEMAEAETSTTAATTTSAKESYASGTPSPAAAKILTENEVSTEKIEGTGKDGRITKADALGAVANKPATPKPQATNKPADITAPAANFSRSTRTQRMSSLRKTISKHLLNAKNSTAMLTTFNEVDLTEIKALRAKYKESFKEKYGVSLGFMGFFMKACATALMEAPGVNAQIDEGNILYHDYADISIAVSTPKGLVVPKVQNVESLNLHEIEIKVKQLALKGRDNKLTMEEMTGGTFTVSNGGVFGSLQSTPIINAPQSAILGMHKIQDRPMAINGEVVIRPMMYLAMSYDHRIIDGKEAVTFLVRIKELLEDPIRLMLSV